MSISNYLEEKILNLVFHGDAFTAPSNHYVSLHTADPGETGVSEVTGGSYARQAATFSAAVNPGGTIATSAALVFASMPATTVTYVGVWDASTAGNFLWGGALVASKVTNAGDTLRIDTGALTASLD